MRDYQSMVVLNYTIYDSVDIVELGTLNPNYDRRTNNSESLIIERVDSREIFEDVIGLESRLGLDHPVVKAGKQVIERMGLVKQEKYFHKEAA
mgnify:CR=1 FL=1